MSVQIASGLSKKYLKLTESTRKGIITPNYSHVLYHQSSKISRGLHFSAKGNKIVNKFKIYS